MKLLSSLQSVKKLVDVTGIEPATPCLQSRPGKTLTALSGVAYTDNQQDSRSPNVPKLYRIGRVWSCGIKKVRVSCRSDEWYRRALKKVC
jgi:hypothetical protein